ncbi:galactose ABC transporter substrate-binding protein [Clostridium vincentii]|uniref:D-galactose/methyl-galactoside binding periplasmic protein MglB n=1 Tax=Clostridium vincentii TaxID=52704 RepID=A0A2T0BAV3_9CLOT|nr:galactose ABC transporter substrate-binding protein [Clostridium vincentii]PRR81004.1 D-galactose-binding periplasmic protein precursor [Clostridium vincentii]
MKKIKNILTVTMVVVIITSILSGCGKKIIESSSKVVEGRPAKVGVLVNRGKVNFIPLIVENLERIQKENPNKVKFFVLDANENQAEQDEYIDKLLKEGVDLILLSISDITASERVINKIKEYNVPVIFFNREPVITDTIKSYEKAFYVGSDPKEIGTMQGEILVDAWNSRKAVIDRNGDNIMQYIILQGFKDNFETIGRTKYSVFAINNAGINTQELASSISNWDKELARQAVAAFLLSQGNKIDVIIANNDGMAEGAIEALQTYGYNLGDKARTIPVVGADGTPAAQELIKRGFMEGTVVQDAKAMAEAIYTIGMNLVSGKKPLEETQYKVDDTGVSIRIPLKKYVNN